MKIATRKRGERVAVLIEMGSTPGETAIQHGKIVTIDRCGYVTVQLDGGGLLVFSPHTDLDDERSESGGDEWLAQRCMASLPPQVLR